MSDTDTGPIVINSIDPATGLPIPVEVPKIQPRYSPKHDIIPVDAATYEQNAGRVWVLRSLMEFRHRHQPPRRYFDQHVWHQGLHRADD